MNRFESQINFIVEIDKLKSVFRRSLLVNGERYENSAEHSWHFAMMAMILTEHYPQAQELTLVRVLKMALIHDLIEIYAGDTYCYDEVPSEDVHARELAAAKKLFSILPSEQGEELFSFWLEFEQGITHDARFARVLDRLNPFMQNFYSEGVSWKRHGVKKSQVQRRMLEIKNNCPVIHQYVERLLANAIAKNWIIDDNPAELQA